MAEAAHSPWIASAEDGLAMTDQSGSGAPHPPCAARWGPPSPRWGEGLSDGSRLLLRRLEALGERDEEARQRRDHGQAAQGREQHAADDDGGERLLHLRADAGGDRAGD